MTTIFSNQSTIRQVTAHWNAFVSQKKWQLGPLSDDDRKETIQLQQQSAESQLNRALEALKQATRAAYYYDQFVTVLRSWSRLKGLQLLEDHFDVDLTDPEETRLFVGELQDYGNTLASQCQHWYQEWQQEQLLAPETLIRELQGLTHQEHTSALDWANQAREDRRLLLEYQRETNTHTREDRRLALEYQKETNAHTQRAYELAFSGFNAAKQEAQQEQKERFVRAAKSTAKLVVAVFVLAVAFVLCAWQATAHLFTTFR